MGRIREIYPSGVLRVGAARRWIRDMFRDSTMDPATCCRGSTLKTASPVCYPSGMAILKVARLGHPVLRAPAAEVPAAEVGEERFQRFIDDMVATMREYQGVGLAAVQVHEPRQVAVLEVADNARYPGKAPVPLSVLVNPRVFPLDDETEDDWEGCLSIPELRGRVPRYRRLRVTALDRDGNDLDFTASGFHARVIQHEVDHLRGRVFLDRMPDLSTLTYLTELSRFRAAPGAGAE